MLFNEFTDIYQYYNCRYTPVLKLIFLCDLKIFRLDLKNSLNREKSNNVVWCHYGQGELS